MSEEQLQIALKAVELYAERHPRPPQVTQTQAAEILGLSRPTVSRLVKHGTIKLNSIGMIPISEIDRVIASR